MRKIALTQRLLLHDSYGEMREALDIQYAGLVKEVGFLPVILPYEISYLDYFNSLDVSGVLLTGGNDLFSFKQDSLSEKRDWYEIQLLEFCIENAIPVLGICRGMQLIAHYFGSSFKPVHGQIGIDHDLLVNNDSLYAKELEGLTQVNSYHNFAIDVLGKELIVSATDKSGVVKAIEHRAIKVFGQMWHSERKIPFSSDEIALIRRVFDD